MTSNSQQSAVCNSDNCGAQTGAERDSQDISAPWRDPPPSEVGIIDVSILKLKIVGSCFYCRKIYVEKAVIL